MYVDCEQTLKRRKTNSNVAVNIYGVSKDKTQMADVKSTRKDASNNMELSESDVYTKLVDTENDLALAKEIGEALLAENVELREKYDNMVEEYTLQIEVLQQEKHKIEQGRKRMTSIQEEKIRELNDDISNLQSQVNILEETSSDDRIEKRATIYELIEENTSLTKQLNAVKLRNKELMETLETVQQNESMSECWDSGAFCGVTDDLQQKLITLEDERKKLDSSLKHMTKEKMGIENEVQILTDKIISLTEELAESKSELSLCEEELNTWKIDNLKLRKQLEEIKLQTSHQAALNGSSIFSEISLLENERSEFSLKLADSPSIKKLSAVHSLQGVPKPLAASSSVNLLNKFEEMQSETSRLNVSCESTDDSSITGDDRDDVSVLLQHGYFAKYEEEQKINIVLRSEMCRVAYQLLDACRLITNDEYQSKQTIGMNIDELFSKNDSSVGTLTMISAEMIGLLREYLDKQQTSKMENITYLEEKISLLENQVEDLTTECFEAKKQLSSLGEQLQKAREEATKNSDEKLQLLHQNSKQEKELQSLRTKYGHIKACRSKSVVEELEKTKRDNERLDSQLITAINQKVRLSEQLEQWQYDMASIIEEQVKKQLNSNVERVKKKTSRLPFISKGWSWK